MKKELADEPDKEEDEEDDDEDGKDKIINMEKNRKICLNTLNVNVEVSSDYEEDDLDKLTNIATELVNKYKVG